MAQTIVQVRALHDNYVYGLGDSSGWVVVDPGTVEAVEELAEQFGGPLQQVWCTHHHPDHVGAVEELLRKSPSLEVLASAADGARISGTTREIAAGDELSIGGHSFSVLEVPGHTLGHIAFYSQGLQALFCGDTLFAGGCGRLFEGSPEQMAHSLHVVLGALPDATKVYCAHEYTLANLRFAQGLEPGNTELQRRLKQVQSLRQEGKATIPSTLAEERATNPFLRCHHPELRTALGAEEQALDWEVFRELRKRKDTA